MPEGTLTVLVILAILAFMYLSRAKKLDTMLRIAELGENVDEKVLAAISRLSDDYRSDYRRSLIWGALGIPVAIAIWMSGEDDRILGFLPLFIAGAYFVSAKLRLKGTNSE